MFRNIAILLMPVLMLSACTRQGLNSGASPADKFEAALQSASSISEMEAVCNAHLVPEIKAAVATVEDIIQSKDLSASEKHRRIVPVLNRIGPTLGDMAQRGLRVLEQKDNGPLVRKVREYLFLARALGEGAARSEYKPYWQRVDDGTYRETYKFAPELHDDVADRFWLFYHWTEIMGGIYDDAQYAWVFADSGRTSFIDEEVGASGIEQFHDWWYVPAAIWDDPSLTANEKFMAAKYTMWQNPHWGGGNHFIDEWWSWEAGYKEEDCALFTGNNMAALAALYELTRDERTFARLRAMFEAFQHYDRFTVNDPDPLAMEEPNGRITRGSKTRNLYPADEMNLFEIEFTPSGIETHHNNSSPDQYTGRERKNVSRDQYYGLFLGYRVAWEVLSGIEDRSPAEQSLLDDLVEHTQQITDYVFGQSNHHWDWGWEYMVYALFEGSCANPPNFTFMMFFGHVGLEEMTGREFTDLDFLHDLGMWLFALGRSLGKVEISAALFEPAHTGLTALNQYLAGFYMSDITPADWLFLWPPELIEGQNASRRRLWRRVVAAYYRKFGLLENAPYQKVAEELFDEALQPVPSPQRFFNSYQGDYVKLEPHGVALDDFILPFSLMASRAQNKEAIMDKLLDRYAALVDNGSINFDDTDLSYIVR